MTNLKACLLQTNIGFLGEFDTNCCMVLMFTIVLCPSSQTTGACNVDVDG